MVRHAALYSLVAVLVVAGLGTIYANLQPRYRLADQVPDKQQAVQASSRLDAKLTGAKVIMLDLNEQRLDFCRRVMGAEHTVKLSDRVEQDLRDLTDGDLTKPIVAMSLNVAQFDGYNLALRIRNAGYTNVYWYRGGREAWEVAGKPEDVVRPADW